MSHNRFVAKLLRVVSILLMGITTFFTIASGAGTSCVALAAADFGDSMAPIAPYQWLYQIFVVVTLAIGILGAWSVYLLVKGRPKSYGYAVAALILGILVGVIHMIVSRELRGKSMPVDAVVYTTVLTLIIFLFLRIPAIWQGVNFEKPVGDEKTGRIAAAITLAICGLLTLTIQVWMSPTHTFGIINYADVWRPILAFIGWGLVGSGAMAAPKPHLTPVQVEIMAEITE